MKIQDFPLPIAGIEFIYTLKCPISGYIIYVGKTNNMHLRYNGHKKDFRGDIPIRKYIKCLVESGQYPVMELLEVCNVKEGCALENYWICQFSAWGFPLLNNRDGQEGIRKLSKQSREKISASATGRRVSIDVKEKLGRKVCKYSLNGEFIELYISEKEALKQNNLQFGIRSAITRDRTAGGYRWRWYSEIFKDNIGVYNPPTLDNSKAAEANRSSVIEVDKEGNVIKMYGSIVEAERETGLHNISAVCRGTRPHAQNRHFKYAKIITQ